MKRKPKLALLTNLKFSPLHKCNGNVTYTSEGLGPPSPAIYLTYTMLSVYSLPITHPLPLSHVAVKFWFRPTLHT